MIRGFKTSEFWVVIAAILNLVIQMYGGTMETYSQQLTEQGIAQVPPQIWASIGGAVAAGLYAIGRGVAKGLGGSA